MARRINSFENFINANDKLRELYSDARKKQTESIEETLRMIDLAKSQNEQQAYDEYVESKTNSRIGNVWEYEKPSEPIRIKNKINPNITDL